MIYIGENEVMNVYVGSDETNVYIGDIPYSDGGNEPLDYDITDDITTYTDRTYDDVYDTSRQKWYKLNNLNEYEEYGLYEDVYNVSLTATSGITEIYSDGTYSSITNTSVSRLSYTDSDNVVYDQYSCGNKGSVIGLRFDNPNSGYTNSIFMGYRTQYGSGSAYKEKINISEYYTPSGVYNDVATSLNSTSWAKYTYNKTGITCKGNYFSFGFSAYKAGGNQRGYFPRYKKINSYCPTRYEGKLVNFHGVEYEFANGQWNNVGVCKKSRVLSKNSINTHITLPSDGKYYVFGYTTSISSTDLFNGGSCKLVKTDTTVRPINVNTTDMSSSSVDMERYVWKAEDAGNGYVYLKNMYTGKYMSFYNVSITEETDTQECPFQFIGTSVVCKKSGDLNGKYLAVTGSDLFLTSTGSNFYAFEVQDVDEIITKEYIQKPSPV